MTELLATRPVQKEARSEEQLLARELELHKIITETYRFNPEACPQEVVKEFQFLQRRRAKQNPPTAPVETPRGSATHKDGFEDRGGKFQQGAPPRKVS